jgi:hypothetical protein
MECRQRGIFLELVICSAFILRVAGGAIGSDCAPKGSNYEQYFAAAPSVAWKVVIDDTGHFQFLDKQSTLQRAVCAQGRADSVEVRRVTQAVMVAWGDAMVREKGGPDQLRICVDDTGMLSAGFASLAKARSLFATSSQLGAMLSGTTAKGAPLEIESSIKNLDALTEYYS